MKFFIFLILLCGFIYPIESYAKVSKPTPQQHEQNNINIDDFKSLAIACDSYAHISTKKSYDDTLNAVYCMAWLHGSLSMEHIFNQYSKNKLWCLPSNITYGEITNSIILYANNHPEYLSYPANIMYSVVLHKFYPCKDEDNSKNDVAPE